MTGSSGARGARDADRSRIVRRKRAIMVALVVGAVALFIDRATKAMAEVWLEPGASVPVLADLLSLRLVYNPGAAFSLGAGSTWILTVLSLVAVIVTIVFAVRLRGVWWGIALGMILGGALGNLLDRLFNPPSFGQGHVTDFIAYGDLFIGNVADIVLVAGFGLIGLRAVIGSRDRRADAADAGDAPAPADPGNGDR